MKLGIDPDQIKGFLEKQEAESLYQFAKKYSSLGPCLEIGSYCGKSAVYLGAAVKENNQILYSIDHHKGSEEQQPGEEFFDPDLLDETGKGINTLPFFLETLDKADLRDNVPEDGGRPPFNIYTKAKESGLFKEVDMINSLALLEKL